MSKSCFFGSLKKTILRVVPALCAALLFGGLVGAPEPPGVAEPDDSLRVLVISSTLRDGDVLAAAAGPCVAVLRYEALETTPAALLGEIAAALGGRRADSIAFAVHDRGAGRFYLTGDCTVGLKSALESDELRAFWAALGDLIAPGGRIDILACDLAAHPDGRLLLSTLEEFSGRAVAASTDKTGNPAHGGDWMLETANIDASTCYFDADPLAEFGGLLAEYEYEDDRRLVSNDPATEDWFGHTVAVDGDYAVVGSYLHDSDSCADSGSAYVFYRNEGGSHNWGLVQEIVEPDPGTYEPNPVEYRRFGYSVAIQGDYIFVGSVGIPFDQEGDTGGAVYVFYRNEGGNDNWGVCDIIKPTDSQGYDRFGFSLAISGDCMIVGKVADYYEGDKYAGSAHIFYRDEGNPDNWTEINEIFPEDPELDSFFGGSVSISGDYAVVGARRATVEYLEEPQPFAGSAYIFYRNEGGQNNWGQVKKLINEVPEPGARFGFSVSVFGDDLIIGEVLHEFVSDANEEEIYYEHGNGKGAAYIYNRNDPETNNWGLVQTLEPEELVFPDHFGMSVQISGDYTVVGSHWNRWEDSQPPPTYPEGIVYLFSRDEYGDWEQVEELKPIETQPQCLGYSVCLSYPYVIAGSVWDTVGSINKAGAAYVFKIGNAVPEVVSLSQDEDSGSSGEFTLTYADADGIEDLNYCYFLVSPDGSTEDAVYLKYDRAANWIYLRNDDDDDWGAGATPGEGTTLSNTQADIPVSAVSVSNDGAEELTLSVTVNFKPAFPGLKNLYMNCEDEASATSGWQAMGTFTVNHAPECASVDPDDAGGTRQTFVATYSDPNGAGDLKYLYFKVNDDTGDDYCAYVRYDAATGLLWLRDDAGTAWLGGYAVGSSNTMGNNQVRVDCIYASATTDGDELTLDVPMAFRIFEGSKYIYMMAEDEGELDSGWQNMGSYTVTSDNHAPEAISVTKAPTDYDVYPLTSQNFYALYRDQDGHLDLWKTQFMINSTFSGENCVYIEYVPNPVAYPNVGYMRLRNDSGTAWSDYYAIGPGGDDLLVSNSQAKMNPKNFRDARPDSTDLELRVPLLFKNNSSFFGVKNVYMYCKDDNGESSAWLDAGTVFELLPPASPPLGEDETGMFSGAVDGVFLPGDTVTFVNRDPEVVKVRWFVQGQELKGDLVDYVFSKPGMYGVRMEGRHEDGTPVISSDNIFIGERLLRAGTVDEFRSRGERMALGARGFDVTDLAKVADEPVIVRLRGRLDWLTRIEFAGEADGDCAYIELEETRAVDTLRWRLGRVVGGTDVAVGYAAMARPESKESMIVLRLDPSGACSMSVDGLELLGREAAFVGARGGLRLRVPFELDEMDIIVSEELR